MLKADADRRRGGMTGEAARVFYGMNAWFLATLTVGALWWVALAGRPAWAKLDSASAAKCYVSTWSRGGPILALFAAASAALGAAAAVDDADLKWAYGAACMAGAILFTVLFMGRIGHALRDRAQDPSFDVHGALRVWGRLHLVRTAMASLGVFFFIWAAH